MQNNQNDEQLKKATTASSHTFNRAPTVVAPVYMCSDRETSAAVQVALGRNK